MDEYITYNIMYYAQGDRTIPLLLRVEIEQILPAKAYRSPLAKIQII